MIRRVVLAAVVAVFAAGFLSVPALAAHCPKDVRQIDAALKMSKLDKKPMKKLKKLRDRGEEQHKNGQHGEAIKTLHVAMKILGISH